MCRISACCRRCSIPGLFEPTAFRTHKATVFVLAGGNASAAETAELVTRLYGKFIKLAHQAKPPVMYSVTRSGVGKPIKFK